MNLRRPILVALLALSSSALLASGATAAVTATNITAPASPIFTLWNENSAAGSVSVTGTATASNGDLVDIRCYSGAVGTLLIANIAVTGGQFSVPSAPLNPIAGRACILRAVPAGMLPGNLTPFAGPMMFNSTDERFDWNGKARDYYIYASQREGAFDYDSFGSCGVTDSYLYDPATLEQMTYPFYCNQWVDDNIAGTASNMTIDGRNAYAADHLTSNMALLPGFQPVGYTLQHDPANGNVTITETQELMVCGTNVYPPTDSNCADVNAAGIRLNRTMVQNHDGLMTRVTDVFTNTSGVAHALSFGYSQWYCMKKNGCNLTTVHYDFPNGQNFISPPTGTLVGALPESGTIYTYVDGSPDGDLTTGRTALTIFPASDGVTFRDSRAFDLFYLNRVIAPGATFRTDAVFSQSASQARLNELVAEAGRLVTPQPTITSGKASVRYDKRKKRVRFNSGRKVACPAAGKDCAVTLSVKTKVKIKRRGGKARTKTYNLGSYKGTVKAGVTSTIVFNLNKTATKLFKSHKRLKLLLALNVTAGQYAGATSNLSLTVKAPRFPRSRR